jgi:class 3 adenylate cyclase/tetratricopeptide (TPR) repeat protein
MENLEQWLESLGLSRYFKLFVDNDLDLEVLPELSEVHLESLGVSLGHRLKLLRAIRQLQSAETPLQKPTHTAVTTAIPQVADASGSVPTDKAERRHLTVMFVDLVGSTELSTLLDPEDLRNVILDYQVAATREIKTFDGFIGRYMGDGILAYFGWPRAHEDDAERAIRAGLAANAVVAALDAPEGVMLRARCGIASGLVVVGDVIGEGASEEEAVVGETPNLAARLQSTAKPGQLVIGENTRRLVGDLFQYEALGSLALKGIAQPVPAFVVGAEKTTTSRYHANRKAAQLPLIGRQAEIGQLQQQWSNALEGEGQAVVISGEAGIGKSRLVDAFCSSCAEIEANNIIVQCSPHHTESALFPVWQWLLRASGASDVHSDDDKFFKITAYLSQWPGTTLLAGLAAANLSISVEATQKLLEQSPDQLRINTLNALLSLFVSMTETSPALVVVEDVHWIDPSTGEFFAELVARTESRHLMLVMTTRPDHSTLQHGFHEAHRINLRRLGRSASTDIINQLTGGRALPEELLGKLLNRTDGVPLYVEELTKTVLESGQLSETAGSYESAGSLESIEVPSSLQDSLMARLDRLWPVREIAQTAAVIGREFSHTLLATVVNAKSDDLINALDKLLESGLIYQRDHNSSVGYIFKHALVRDAAYNSLLKSRRREIHASIAEVLANDEEFGDMAEPQLLAKHYLCAENYAEAVKHNLLAAQKALSNSANKEALVHTRAGINLLDKLDAHTRSSIEQELHFCSAMAQRILRGFHSDEYLEAITRAGELAELNHDIPTQVNCVRGQFNHYFNRGKHKDGDAVIHHQLEPLLTKLNSVSPGATKGANHLYRGELQYALEDLIQMIGTLDTAENYPERAFVLNPVTATLANLGWTRWLLGYPEQALADGMLAVDTARQIEQPFSYAMAVVWVGHTQCATGFSDNWEAVLEEAGELIEKYDIQAWAPRVKFLKGRYMAASTDTAVANEGLDIMQQSLLHIGKRGSKLSWTWMCAELAEAYHDHSHHRQCEELLASGIQHAQQNDEKFWLSELYRISSRTGLPNSKQAEARQLHLKKALAEATATGARSCELRVHLERCKQNPGAPQPLQKLSETVATFTEGFATKDLQEAIGVLKSNQLSSGTDVEASID